MAFLLALTLLHPATTQSQVPESPDAGSETGTLRSGKSSLYVDLFNTNLLVTATIFTGSYFVVDH